jgi:hypothetical protein
MLFEVKLEEYAAYQQAQAEERSMSRDSEAGRNDVL